VGGDDQFNGYAAAGSEQPEAETVDLFLSAL
jgi:hypothetical protein